MLKLDYNPCERKYKQWLAKFSKEQQQKINEIGDNTDLFCKLIKLKRNRKPVEVNVGDVFLVSNKEGIYFYGKVVQRVNTQHPKYDWSEESFVAFIFKSVSKEKRLDNYVPNYNDCVCGPKIFDATYWRKGYFEIIGNIPLTKEEKKLDIGFFDEDSGGIFFDARGKTLLHFPKFYNCLGFITFGGIARSLSTAYVTNPELFE